jgi:hypothetical protein
MRSLASFSSVHVSVSRPILTNVLVVMSKEAPAQLVLLTSYSHVSIVKGEGMSHMSKLTRPSSAVPITQGDRRAPSNSRRL